MPNSTKSGCTPGSTNNFTAVVAFLSQAYRVRADGTAVTYCSCGGLGFLGTVGKRSEIDVHFRKLKHDWSLIQALIRDRTPDVVGSLSAGMPLLQAKDKAKRLRECSVPALHPAQGCCMQCRRIVGH